MKQFEIDRQVARCNAQLRVLAERSAAPVTADRYLQELRALVACEQALARKAA